MQKRYYLINTITDWREPPRARHQIAEAISKKYDVVFVSSNRVGSPNHKIIRESDKLEVFIPYFPVNYKIRYRIPVLNNVYQNWLYKRLQKKYPDAIVINFDFTAFHINNFFSNTIYYCNDDFIGMSRKLNPKWIARYHEECEKKLALKVNFCVGTSEYLTNRLKAYNNNVFEIRLGAPKIENFQFDKLNVIQEPEQINVGIVGYIQSINAKTLDFLASKEDLKITLVGPANRKDLKRFRDKENIRITGILTGVRLHEEISRFHVGLIPYKFNSTVDRTPNKLWLYLALGVPTVISNIRGIRNWQFPDKFVYRANNDQEFYELIKLAHIQDNDQLAEKRREYARQNTWEARMDHFFKLVNRFIEVKGGNLGKKNLKLDTKNL